MSCLASHHTPHLDKGHIAAGPPLRWPPEGFVPLLLLLVLLVLTVRFGRGGVFLAQQHLDEEAGHVRPVVVVDEPALFYLLMVLLVEMVVEMR